MGRRSPAPVLQNLVWIRSMQETSTSLQNAECDFHLDDLAGQRISGEIRFQRLAVAQVNRVIELELVNDWLAEHRVVVLLGSSRRLPRVHRDVAFHPRSF